MRRRLTTVVLVVLGLGVAAAGILFALDYLEDPPNASCNGPSATFGPIESEFDHSEVPVRFTCEGAALAGTLFLPLGAGPHPAAVWVHGAGPAPRLGFGNLVREFVDAGVAVFSYDKRGVGESGGSCCPGDNGRFNLLSADAAGAVAAIASRPDIRQSDIGFIGASQAGWIAAKAAAQSGKVAFIGLASATPISEKLTNLYERLARGDQGQLSKEEISRRLVSAGPSGFDPLPYLRQTTAPSFWMVGTEDDRIPVPETVALLNQLKNEGRAVEVVIFQGAGHGLVDTPPTDPNALPTLVQWVVGKVHVAGR